MPPSTLASGVNGNITVDTDGTGQVVINADVDINGTIYLDQLKCLIDLHTYLALYLFIFFLGTQRSCITYFTGFQAVDSYLLYITPCLGQLGTIVHSVQAVVPFTTTTATTGLGTGLVNCLHHAACSCQAFTVICWIIVASVGLLGSHPFA